MLIMKTFLVMGFGALSIIRPSMQLFMICKCIISSKKFVTNSTFMPLFFMYTSKHVFYVHGLKKMSYRRDHI